MKQAKKSILLVALLSFLPITILLLKEVRDNTIREQLYTNFILVKDLFYSSIVDLGSDEYYAVSIETFTKEAMIILSDYSPRVLPVRGYIFPGNLLADKFEVFISYDHISLREVLCCAKIC